MHNETIPTMICKLLKNKSKRSKKNIIQSKCIQMNEMCIHNFVLHISDSQLKDEKKTIMFSVRANARDMFEAGAE